jgi:HSP20 family protein
MSTTALANRTRTLPSFFDELFSPSFFFDDFLTKQSYSPSVDINYGDDKITLDMILAGTPKENINVEVKGGKLFINAEKNENKIERSYKLPDDIDSDNISAKYENGILNVVLRKNVKVDNIKTIEIQ